MKHQINIRHKCHADQTKLGQGQGHCAQNVVRLIPCSGMHLEMCPANRQERETMTLKQLLGDIKHLNDTSNVVLNHNTFYIEVKIPQF